MKTFEEWVAYLNAQHADANSFVASQRVQLQFFYSSLPHLHPLLHRVTLDDIKAAISFWQAYLPRQSAAQSLQHAVQQAYTPEIKTYYNTELSAGYTATELIISLALNKRIPFEGCFTATTPCSANRVLWLLAVPLNIINCLERINSDLPFYKSKIKLTAAENFQLASFSIKENNTLTTVDTVATLDQILKQPKRNTVEIKVPDARGAQEHEQFFDSPNFWIAYLQSQHAASGAYIRKNAISLILFYDRHQSLRKFLIAETIENIQCIFENWRNYIYEDSKAEARLNEAILMQLTDDIKNHFQVMFTEHTPVETTLLILLKHGVKNSGTFGLKPEERIDKTVAVNILKTQYVIETQLQGDDESADDAYKRRYFLMCLRYPHLFTYFDKTSDNINNLFDIDEALTAHQCSAGLRDDARLLFMYLAFHYLQNQVRGHIAKKQNILTKLFELYRKHHDIILEQKDYILVKGERAVIISQTLYYIDKNKSLDMTQAKKIVDNICKMAREKITPAALGNTVQLTVSLPNIIEKFLELGGAIRAAGQDETRFSTLARTAMISHTLADMQDVTLDDDKLEEFFNLSLQYHPDHMRKSEILDFLTVFRAADIYTHFHDTFQINPIAARRQIQYIAAIIRFLQAESQTIDANWIPLIKIILQSKPTGKLKDKHIANVYKTHTEHADVLNAFPDGISQQDYSLIYSCLIELDKLKHTDINYTETIKKALSILKNIPARQINKYTCNIAMRAPMVLAELTDNTLKNSDLKNIYQNIKRSSVFLCPEDEQINLLLEFSPNYWAKHIGLKIDKSDKALYIRYNNLSSATLAEYRAELEKQVRSAQKASAPSDDESIEKQVGKGLTAALKLADKNMQAIALDPKTDSETCLTYVQLFKLALFYPKEFHKIATLLKHAPDFVDVMRIQHAIKVINKSKGNIAGFYREIWIPLIIIAIYAHAEIANIFTKISPTSIAAKETNTHENIALLQRCADTVVGVHTAPYISEKEATIVVFSSFITNIVDEGFNDPKQYPCLSHFLTACAIICDNNILSIENKLKTIAAYAHYTKEGKLFLPEDVDAYFLTDFYNTVLCEHIEEMIDISQFNADALTKACVATLDNADKIARFHRKREDFFDFMLPKLEHDAQANQSFQAQISYLSLVYYSYSETISAWLKTDPKLDAQSIIDQMTEADAHVRTLYDKLGKSYRDATDDEKNRDYSMALRAPGIFSDNQLPISDQSDLEKLRAAYENIYRQLVPAKHKPSARIDYHLRQLLYSQFKSTGGQNSVSWLADTWNKLKLHKHLKITYSDLSNNPDKVHWEKRIFIIKLLYLHTRYPAALLEIKDYACYARLLNAESLVTTVLASHPRVYVTTEARTTLFALALFYPDILQMADTKAKVDSLIESFDYANQTGHFKTTEDWRRCVGLRNALAGTGVTLNDTNTPDILALKLILNPIEWAELLRKLENAFAASAVVSPEPDTLQLYRASGPTPDMEPLIDGEQSSDDTEVTTPVRVSTHQVQHISRQFALYAKAMYLVEQSSLIDKSKAVLADWLLNNLYAHIDANLHAVELTEVITHSFENLCALVEQSEAVAMDTKHFFNFEIDALEFSNQIYIPGKVETSKSLFKFPVQKVDKGFGQEFVHNKCSRIHFIYNNDLTDRRDEVGRCIDTRDTQENTQYTRAALKKIFYGDNPSTEQANLFDKACTYFDLFELTKLITDSTNGPLINLTQFGLRFKLPSAFSIVYFMHTEILKEDDYEIKLAIEEDKSHHSAAQSQEENSGVHGAFSTFFRVTETGYIPSFFTFKGTDNFINYVTICLFYSDLFREFILNKLSLRKDNYQETVELICLIMREIDSLHQVFFSQSNNDQDDHAYIDMLKIHKKSLIIQDRASGLDKHRSIVIAWLQLRNATVYPIFDAKLMKLIAGIFNFSCAGEITLANLPQIFLAFHQSKAKSDLQFHIFNAFKGLLTGEVEIRDFLVELSQSRDYDYNNKAKESGFYDAIGEANKHIESTLTATIQSFLPNADIFTPHLVPNTPACISGDIQRYIKISSTGTTADVTPSQLISAFANLLISTQCFDQICQLYNLKSGGELSVAQVIQIFIAAIETQKLYQINSHIGYAQRDLFLIAISNPGLLAKVQQDNLDYKNIKHAIKSIDKSFSAVFAEYKKHKIDYTQIRYQLILDEISQPNQYARLMQASGVTKKIRKDVADLKAKKLNKKEKQALRVRALAVYLRFGYDLGGAFNDTRSPILLEGDFKSVFNHAVLTDKVAAAISGPEKTDVPAIFAALRHASGFLDYTRLKGLVDESDVTIDTLKNHIKVYYIIDAYQRLQPYWQQVSVLRDLSLPEKTLIQKHLVTVALHYHLHALNSASKLPEDNICDHLYSTLIDQIKRKIQYHDKQIVITRFICLAYILPQLKAVGEIDADLKARTVEAFIINNFDNVFVKAMPLFLDIMGLHVTDTEKREIIVALSAQLNDVTDSDNLDGLVRQHNFLITLLALGQIDFIKKHFNVLKDVIKTLIPHVTTPQAMDSLVEDYHYLINFLDNSLASVFAKTLTLAQSSVDIIDLIKALHAYPTIVKTYLSKQGDSTQALQHIFFCYSQLTQAQETDSKLIPVAESLFYLLVHSNPDVIMQVINKSPEEITTEATALMKTDSYGLPDDYSEKIKTKGGIDAILANLSLTEKQATKFTQSDIRQLIMLACDYDETAIRDYLKKDTQESSPSLMNHHQAYYNLIQAAHIANTKQELSATNKNHLFHLLLYIPNILDYEIDLSNLPQCAAKLSDTLQLEDKEAFYYLVLLHALKPALYNALISNADIITSQRDTDTAIVSRAIILAILAAESRVHNLFFEADIFEDNQGPDSQIDDEPLLWAIEQIYQSDFAFEDKIPLYRLLITKYCNDAIIIDPKADNLATLCEKLGCTAIYQQAAQQSHLAIVDIPLATPMAMQNFIKASQQVDRLLPCIWEAGAARDLSDHLFYRRLVQLAYYKHAPVIDALLAQHADDAHTRQQILDDVVQADFNASQFSITDPHAATLFFELVLCYPPFTDALLSIMGVFTIADIDSQRLQTALLALAPYINQSWLMANMAGHHDLILVLIKSEYQSPGFIQNIIDEHHLTVYLNPRKRAQASAHAAADNLKALFAPVIYLVSRYPRVLDEITALDAHTGVKLFCAWQHLRRMGAMRSSDGTQDNNQALDLALKHPLLIPHIPDLKVLKQVLNARNQLLTTGAFTVSKQAPSANKQPHHFTYLLGLAIYLPLQATADDDDSAHVTRSFNDVLAFIQPNQFSKVARCEPLFKALQRISETGMSDAEKQQAYALLVEHFIDDDRFDADISTDIITSMQSRELADSYTGGCGISFTVGAETVVDNSIPYLYLGSELGKRIDKNILFSDDDISLAKAMLPHPCQALQFKDQDPGGSFIELDEKYMHITCRPDGDKAYKVTCSGSSEFQWNTYAMLVAHDHILKYIDDPIPRLNFLQEAKNENIKRAGFNKKGHYFRLRHDQMQHNLFTFSTLQSNMDKVTLKSADSASLESDADTLFKHANRDDNLKFTYAVKLVKEATEFYRHCYPEAITLEGPFVKLGCSDDARYHCLLERIFFINTIEHELSGTFHHQVLKCYAALLGVHYTFGNDSIVTLLLRYQQNANRSPLTNNIAFYTELFLCGEIDILRFYHEIFALQQYPALNPDAKHAFFKQLHSDYQPLRYHFSKKRLQRYKTILDVADYPAHDIRAILAAYKTKEADIGEQPEYRESLYVALNNLLHGYESIVSFNRQYKIIKKQAMTAPEPMPLRESAYCRSSASVTLDGIINTQLPLVESHVMHLCSALKLTISKTAAMSLDNFYIVLNDLFTNEACIQYFRALLDYDADEEVELEDMLPELDFLLSLDAEPQFLPDDIFRYKKLPEPEERAALLDIVYLLKFFMYLDEFNLQVQPSPADLQILSNNITDLNRETSEHKQIHLLPAAPVNAATTLTTTAMLRAAVYAADMHSPPALADGLGTEMHTLCTPAATPGNQGHTT